jgi:PEP-CTERM motif
MRLRASLLLNLVLLLCMGLLSAQASFGDSITIYNTGESNQGTALAFGTVDPHYNLIAAPSGVGLVAYATSLNPAWISGDSSADWISPGASGDTSWPVGTYDYQTTFMVTDPSTAELSGEWTSDNNACIYLDGVNTGICTAFAGFGSLNPFDISSGFQSGMNTLDLVVTNGGNSPSPTGVLVEFTPQPPSTPEPSTVLLLGSGLLGLAVAARRRLAR